MSANADEVRAELKRILDSRHFSNAPKKQKFLRLLCDFYLQGKAPELNEYLIGREVFDRDESYNPADDPIVRVGAHDVRKKLELYYQNEGANDEVRLEIPIGSYEPVFNRRIISAAASVAAAGQRLASVPGTQAPSLAAIISADVLEKDHSAAVEPGGDSISATAPGGGNRLRRGLFVLSGVTALLVLLAGALLWENLRLQRQAREIPAAVNQAGTVWQPFFQSNQQVLLVLSNPAVFRLVNAGDSETAVKSSIPLTPGQAATLNESLKDNFVIRNTPPNPRLVLSIDTYTGVGEAIGAQRVTDLLRTAGKPVLLKRSRTVSAEDLRDHSVILFGSVWSNEWSGKLPQTEDFVITGQAAIENRNVRTGEDHEYRSRFDERSGKLIEDYALITVKPNITEDNPLMVLAGLRSAGTEAAAEFITNRNFLNDLNKQLHQAGTPSFYQALLRVGVENGIPTTISLLAIHALRNH